MATMAKEVLLCFLMIWIFSIEGAVLSNGSGIARSRREIIPEWLNTVQMAHYGSSRYVIRLVIKNWDDANADCSRLGGYLAEMDSEAEWTHVHAERVRLDGNNGHWLGAKGYGIYGGWKWTKSQKFIKSCPRGVGNWESSQPNEDNEACMYMRGKKNDNWYDFTCTTRFHFICEFS